MKSKIILCVFNLFVSFTFCFSQKKNAEVEITPFLRWDSYPKFQYAINPTNSNTLKMKGTSIGLNLAYKLYSVKNWAIKTGVGYYRYSFTKMKQINTLFGESKTRVIHYIPPGPLAPALIYTTDRYWYNSIMLNVEINKSFFIKERYLVAVGTQMNNYFTYSQLYHIRSGAKGINYRKGNGRYFGYSVLFTGSFQKKIGKINMGPVILIPVYDAWKKDKNFPQEMDNGNRSKSFTGFGIGFTFNIPLN